MKLGRIVRWGPTHALSGTARLDVYGTPWLMTLCGAAADPAMLGGQPECAWCQRILAKKKREWGDLDDVPGVAVVTREGLEVTTLRVPVDGTGPPCRKPKSEPME